MTTTVAKLLARKRQLLERLQEDLGPNEREEIERLLEEIDTALTSLKRLARVRQAIRKADARRSLKPLLMRRPCLPCPRPGDDLKRIIRQRSLQRLRLIQGARIQTSYSSSVVRITGIALGMDQLDDGIFASLQDWGARLRGI